MASIAKPTLGSKNEIERNGEAIKDNLIEKHSGLVGFYEFGQTPGGNVRPIVLVSGENGSVDIGGTKDRHGLLVLRDKNMIITLVVDGESGTISQNGDSILFDKQGAERVRISGQGVEISLKNSNGVEVIFIDGDSGKLVVGGGGKNGDLQIRDSSSNVTIHLSGEQGHALLRGLTVEGTASCQQLTVSGSGSIETLVVSDTVSAKHLKVSGDATAANLNVSGGINTKTINVTETVDAKHLKVSGDATAANLNVSEGVSTKTLNVTETVDAKQLTAKNLNLSGVNLTGNGTDITVKGNILLQNADGKTAIRIDANEGDIILEQADCAEDFDIVCTETATRGAVMVLDANGRLEPCSKAYDTRVVGVVSGAGDYRPGIVLDKRVDSANRLPIALIGKVFCQVSAEFGSVEIGDLLVSSSIPGFAMKANDQNAAFGAVIGKALKPLKTGQGLVPVLVALQ